jgi:hypothetical protein
MCTSLPTFYGFTIIGLLWEILFIIPFVLLFWHKEKLLRLYHIGVGAYVLGFLIYQFVRIARSPHSPLPDRWMLIGPLVLAVVFLMKMAEERLVPHEKERSFKQNRSTAMVMYIIFALVGLFLLTASFIWQF